MPDSGKSVRFSLRGDARGKRLDQVLAGQIGDWSRSRLQALIKAGNVRLDGAIVKKPGQILMQGGEIEVDLAIVRAPAHARAFVEPRVVCEDEHLVVLDKPAGLLTHRNANTSETSVADWANERYGPLPSVGGEDRHGIAHRLDRGTSGLLVLGRTEAALLELKREFHAREVEKTYAALVHGEPRFDSDWIQSWLGRTEKHRDRISTVPENEGRFASTYFEVRERFRGFALLSVFPKTGRTHQVRVHLSSIGHPLIGESLYFPKRRQMERLPSDAPKIERQALHAQRLGFKHPATREPLTFESPLPRDMSDVVEWLRANRPE